VECRVPPAVRYLPCESWQVDEWQSMKSCNTQVGQNRAGVQSKSGQRPLSRRGPLSISLRVPAREARSCIGIEALRHCQRQHPFVDRPRPLRYNCIATPAEADAYRVRHCVVRSLKQIQSTVTGECYAVCDPA
jgi:hypothetical protein